MLVLAHSGHWLVNLLYMGPVLVIVSWISVNAIRDDRRAKREARPGPKEL